jgi:hypothetical protein
MQAATATTTVQLRNQACDSARHAERQCKIILTIHSLSKTINNQSKALAMTLPQGFDSCGNVLAHLAHSAID